MARIVPKDGLTNAAFAETDGFVKACEKAGIKPTARQASKYRNKRGSAYKATHVVEAKEESGS